MEITATYTEDELLTMLKAKDWKAFSYLYENYSGGLYSTILQIIPEREQANQVLLETFIYILLNTNGYQSDKSSLFTWMLHIARKLSIGVLRSGDNRHKQEALENVRTGQQSVAENGLKKALQHLTPEERDIFELVYFKGYSYEEIAAMNNQPAATAKQQLKKALIQLREILK